MFPFLFEGFPTVDAGDLGDDEVDEMFTILRDITRPESTLESRIKGLHKLADELESCSIKCVTSDSYDELLQCREDFKSRKLLFELNSALYHITEPPQSKNTIEHIIDFWLFTSEEPCRDRNILNQYDLSIASARILVALTEDGVPYDIYNCLYRDENVRRLFDWLERRDIRSTLALGLLRDFPIHIMISSKGKQKFDKFDKLLNFLHTTDDANSDVYFESSKGGQSFGENAFPHAIGVSGDHIQLTIRMMKSCLEVHSPDVGTKELVDILLKKYKNAKNYATKSLIIRTLSILSENRAVGLRYIVELGGFSCFLEDSHALPTYGTIFRLLHYMTKDRELFLYFLLEYRSFLKQILKLGFELIRKPGSDYVSEFICEIVSYPHVLRQIDEVQSIECAASMVSPNYMSFASYYFEYHARLFYLSCNGRTDYSETEPIDVRERDMARFFNENPSINWDRLDYYIANGSYHAFLDETANTHETKSWSACLRLLRTFTIFPYVIEHLFLTQSGVRPLTEVLKPSNSKDFNKLDYLVVLDRAITPLVTKATKKTKLEKRIQNAKRKLRILLLRHGIVNSILTSLRSRQQNHKNKYMIRYLCCKCLIALSRNEEAHQLLQQAGLEKLLVQLLYFSDEYFFVRKTRAYGLFIECATCLLDFFATRLPFARVVECNSSIQPVPPQYLDLSRSSGIRNGTQNVLEIKGREHSLDNDRILQIFQTTTDREDMETSVDWNCGWNFPEKRTFHQSIKTFLEIQMRDEIACHVFGRKPGETDLFIACDTSLQRVNYVTGRVIESYGLQIDDISISDDGNLIFLSSYDGISLSSTNNPSDPLIRFKEYSKGRMSHSGKKAVLTLFDYGELYDIEHSKTIAKLNPVDDLGRRMIDPFFSPDDNALIFGGILWDVRVATPIYNFPYLGSSSVVDTQNSGCFHPSGNEILLNSEVWDFNTFKLLHSVDILSGANSAYLEGGDMLLTCSRVGNPKCCHQCNAPSMFFLDPREGYEIVNMQELGFYGKGLSLNYDDSLISIASSFRLFLYIFGEGRDKEKVEDHPIDENNGFEPSLRVTMNPGFRRQYTHWSDEESENNEEDIFEESFGGGVHEEDFEVSSGEEDYLGLL